MNYIKVDNGNVQVAGVFANQAMLDSGFVEYKGEIPILNPNQKYGWDEQNSVIIPVSKFSEIAMRNRRDQLLKVCDSISPLRWSSFTKAQQKQWSDFRQALLDLPQQNGFPDVELPTQPFKL